MAKMIINGEVCSGSSSYASAVEYIKEDGSKSTVQDEISELNKKMPNYSVVLNVGEQIKLDLNGATQALLYTFGTATVGNSIFMLRKTATPNFVVHQVHGNASEISVVADSEKKGFIIKNNSTTIVIIRMVSFDYEPYEV